MKHCLCLLWCLSLGALAWGQSEVAPAVAVPATGVDAMELAPVSYEATGVPLPDSVPLRLRAPLAFDAPVAFPSQCGWWDVHKGFNASVGAGVMCDFGKGNPYRGAAFFTSLEGLYALPVNDRLTVAAGMGYTRYTGWGQSQGALDLFGLASYRISARLEATVFVSHNFGPLGGGAHNALRTPYIPGISNACTTVGAEFGIKLNDVVRVGVGVSVVREETPHHGIASPPDFR